VYDYSDFKKARPLIGKIEHGEVEAIPERRANPRWGPYGLVFSSPFLSVTREAVRFPGGNEGTHLRLFQGAPDQEVFGVLILPIRPRPGAEPEIGCVRQFRYPRQGWMLEAPRGGVGSREHTPTGAVRELREETGLPHPDILLHMDDLVNDSGMSATVCSYYLAVYMNGQEGSGPLGDSREAIRDVVWLPLSEWREQARHAGGDRPDGGLDALTAAAYGLAHLSGALVRVGVAWNRIFEGRVGESMRLSPLLRGRLGVPDALFDVHIDCRDAAAAAKLKRELPLLEMRSDPSRTAVVRAYDTSLLTLVWLTLHPGVLEIRGIDEAR
jgi:8-oxo-dGTP pyrophosphatase MutT (NUDIX family)